MVCQWSRSDHALDAWSRYLDSAATGEPRRFKRKLNGSKAMSKRFHIITLIIFGIGLVFAKLNTDSADPAGLDKTKQILIAEKHGQASTARKTRGEDLSLRLNENF